MKSGRYKAYPKYSATGTAWLESVPEKWDMFDGKRIFESCREPAYSTDEQLAASQKFGVVPQSLMMELNDAKVMLALKGTSSFRHVEKNDYVISLRSFEGGIEYSAYTGCVSPAYTVLRPTKPISSGFYKHLFKSKPYISALQATTNSLRDGKAINYEQFGAIPLILPPVSEQTQIARFLDHETAKIDRLIEKQQALIALLKEKRQAVISHAVTKGLNPSALLKDSDIEWLGQVPAHWSVKSLRYLGKCQNGLNIGGEAFGSGYPFISYGDVYKNRVLPETGSGLVQSTKDDRLTYSVETGDVFFTRTSETIEEIGFSSTCLKTIENATFAGFLIRFRPDSDALEGDFAKHYFSGSFLRAFFVKEMNLVTRASLSQDLLKQLAVALPPRNEQRQIASFLDEKVATFSRLTDDTLSVITLLQERRTALISAAVTGKIDVRHWQPPSYSETKP